MSLTNLWSLKQHGKTKKGVLQNGSSKGIAALS